MRPAALVYHIPPDADMEDTTAARDWRHGAAAKDRRIGRWTVNACPLTESLDTPGHLLPSMAVELPTSIWLRLALVGADEGAAGQLPALQGAAQGPRPTALRSAPAAPRRHRLGRSTGAGRHRPAAWGRRSPPRRSRCGLHGGGRMLALGQPGRGRLEPGQHPVGEGAAGGVGVLAQHGQLDRLLRHPGPLQGRRQVVVVLGVAGRDRLVVAEGRAAQLDAGHAWPLPAGQRPKPLRRTDVRTNERRPNSSLYSIRPSRVDA